MNKPRFMSTPIPSHDADLHLDTELSAKDTLTFDDMDVTIPFGIDLFSDDHVANIREHVINYSTCDENVNQLLYHG